MNHALLCKAVRDARLQLVLSAAGLVLFAWLYGWLVAQLPVGAFATMLRWLPDMFRPLLGAPVAELATPAGQLSILFVHIITMLVAIGWAVGRGSDPIAGEISRGTMDLVVSLPVRRHALLVPSALVAAAGAAVLSLALWGGIALAVKTVDFKQEVSPWRFAPGVINLFAMVFFMTGLTTLVSTWIRDRWYVIAASTGFFILSFIVKMTARLWPAGWPEAVDIPKWLLRATFLSLFEPQEMILVGPGGWLAGWPSSAGLIALGLAAYVAAALVFRWRDVPTVR